VKWLRGKIGWFALVAVLAGALFFLFSKRERLDASRIPYSAVNDFDIILSQGQSIESRIVRLLDINTQRSFSHAGIIIKNKGIIRVFHATPDGTKENCLRFDDLQTFFNLSNVCDCVILRCRDLTADQRAKLLSAFESYRYKIRPFNYKFDNTDQSKLYCTELIWLIFNKAGIFSNHDFDLSKPIAPSDFLSCRKLRQILP